MSTSVDWDQGGITWDDPSIFWDFANLRPSEKPLEAVPGTVYIPFVPSSSSNFQFQATFDAQVYTVIVTWSLFGQRYYVNIYDSSGVLIVALPMIGSPDFYNVSLTAGYFTTQLVWRVQSGNFEVIG